MKLEVIVYIVNNVICSPILPTKFEQNVFFSLYFPLKLEIVSFWNTCILLSISVCIYLFQDLIIYNRYDYNNSLTDPPTLNSPSDIT